MKFRFFLFITALFLAVGILTAQENKAEKKDGADPAAVFGGLKWRNIGPAFTSGRIADFAVNPINTSEYFVAVASGNIWKTTNHGTTWEPVFDGYGAYSIGCLAMDPNNHNVVWAGTGENNHQRALGYGDGVYKTEDGGRSWKNMGLKESRQVGRILIDPRNSNVVFVAAEGSVWGPGGERGLYKTRDGGKTWKKVLHISEHTGVNDVLCDPRHPDIMYATSEQRRRHVFTKIGGGPESAVYKSQDGGETWEKIMSGLPTVDIGGMGLAISPVDPDVVYLIMEAAEGKGGFFRSRNRGASWEKMSDHSAQGQYYNEIYCDPKNVDRIYSVETISQVSDDGGKTWRPIGNNGRHVDDHAMWIDPADTTHFLIGGDGGIYETYDGGRNFRFIENLPVTQFYRVFVDNRLPFYYVYGGTQDNNSMGGPSRTISGDGIVNSDWVVTCGGDGFFSAVDPVDPDIVYAESQYGGMVRYDRKSGESVSIRPEPRQGEKTYRWYWNTPLIVSQHKPTRIYCAANKVFRSDDRGDSWTVISDDLSAQIDRDSSPVMGKYWSRDAVQKNISTSLYGLITALAESPLDENLLVVGTDDGLIQITEDGGRNWRKAGAFPGVPANTFVSAVYTSRFDKNVLFAAFDNIKRDDFKPYLLMSGDLGKTWKSIAADLPANGTVHAIEQDFVDPALLFVGTEFGFHFSQDGGGKWTALKNDLPTIAVRHIAIQKRECDLVLATFGRGFYVLDDYSPLRLAKKEVLAQAAHIFPIKDALMYVPSDTRYGQGSTYFKAPNPDFGAVFTYYLQDAPKTLKTERREKEKVLFKEGKPIPQPTEEQLQAEAREIAPYLLFTIRDESGAVVRRLTRAAAKGVQRLNWDLAYSSFQPVSMQEKFKPTADQRSSFLALPGKYSVAMELVTRDGVKELVKAIEFNVVPLRNTTLPAPDRAALVAFQKKAAELARTVLGTMQFTGDLQKRVETLKQTLLHTPAAPFDWMKKAEALALALEAEMGKLRRDSSRPSDEENDPAPVSLLSRMQTMVYTHFNSTSALTRNETLAFEVLQQEFPPVLQRVKKLADEVQALEKEFEKSGAPWTPGRTPELR